MASAVYGSAGLGELMATACYLEKLIMNKIIRLVAFLAVLLPASFVAAQETWTFTPRLEYAGGTTASQMVFEAYIDASSSDTSASSLWFVNAEFAMLFDSSNLEAAVLTTLLEGYTVSDADLKGTQTGSDAYVEGNIVIISFAKAPGATPTRSCTPTGGACRIVLGTFTIPNIAANTNLRVAWGRLDNLSIPDHVSSPATPDSPFQASFSPAGFTGTLTVNVTDTVLTFPPPAPTVTMSATTTAVDEIAVATIAVGVSPAPGSDLTLNYTIAADTDGLTMDAVVADYSDANSGTIMILSGNTAADIMITAVDDNLAEMAEVFVVTLSSVTATDGSTVLLGTEVENTVTIAANDTPEVTLAGPAEVLRGNTATYTVNLSTEPTADVVLAYAITGTATAVTHYGDPVSGTATVDATAFTVTIPSGDASGTFTIVTTTAAAGTNISVTLSAPMGGGGETPTLGAVVVTTSISDAIAISVPATLTLNEGVSEGLTVTAGSAVGADTTVTYTVTGGTAGAADYSVTGTSVVIPSGETEIDIPVSVTEDGLFEVAEIFTITLTDAASSAGDVAVSANATTTVTIAEDVNDAIEVSLTGDGAVREGNTATYTVTLTGGTSTDDVTVPYIVSGTATSGADYTAPSSPVVIAAGSSSGVISIVTIDEGGGDDGETLIVTLGAPTGGGGPASSLTVNGALNAVTTMISEGISISMGAPTASVEEGSAVTLQVRLTEGAPAGGITVGYAISPGEAVAADYTDGTGGSVTFSTGESTADIQITAVDDPNSEGAETFTVTLDTVTGDATVSSSAGNTVVTINESDPITVSLAGPAGVGEGDPATYTVTLTGGTSTTAVMVVYTVTAGAGMGATVSDFAGGSFPTGTITIPSGTSSMSFDVATMADATDDDETFVVTLSGPSGGGGQTSLGSSQMIETTITELPTVTIAPIVSVLEGESAPITVTSSAQASVGIVVNYTVTIESGDTAETDDFSGTGGTVTIPASMTSVDISVAVADDRLSEGDETFTVTLTSVTTTPPGGARLGSDVASVVTIGTDPNDNVVLSLTGPSTVSEGQVASYTVNTGGIPTEALMVLYTVGGTAADGTDYMDAGSSPLTIGPGQAGQSGGMIVLMIEDDGVADPDETLIVMLISVTGGRPGSNPTVVAPNSVTTTITEGDPEKALQYSLAGFMRSTASGTVEVIGDRFRTRAAAGGASSFTLGGQDVSGLLSFEEGSETYQTLTGLAERFGVDTPSGPLSMMGSAATDGLDLGGMGALAGTAQSWLGLSEMSLQELLAQSSFEMSLDGGRGGAGPGSWGFWGRGDYSGFEGRPEDGFSMDGTVYSGMAGVDYQWNDLLVGLSVGHSNGEIDYAGSAAGTGQIEANLTSIHPYLQWSPGGEGHSVVWGALGFGWGDAEIMDMGETDLEMYMVAVGLRQDVYSAGEMDVSVNSDAFYVSSETDAATGVADAVDADTMRLRVAVEVGRTWEQAAGSSITTSIELGGRFDGGDAEEGAGAELGGEIGYENLPGGVDVSARGRYLVAHSESDFEEWAASVEVSLNPGGPGGRGLQFSLIPKWGSAASRVDSMWQGTSALALDSSGSTRGSGSGLSPDSLDMEVGYGMSLRSRAGVLTPFGELGLADSDSRRARLGLRLGLLDGSGQETIRMELSGEHSARGNDTEPDQQVGLTGEFRF